MFENIHIPISAFIGIIYLYSMDIKTKFIAEGVDASRQSIYHVTVKILGNVDNSSQETKFGKVGSGDRIVEIDENHI